MHLQEMEKDRHTLKFILSISMEDLCSKKGK